MAQTIRDVTDNAVASAERTSVTIRRLGEASTEITDLQRAVSGYRT